jgi:protein-S-isoprenylcysteine O-methyltransferase Ste14
MTGLLVAVRALFFACCFWAFWMWVAFAVEPFDARLFALTAWTAAPGVALMAAGAALMVACIAVFVGVGGGTPAPFDAPRRFVAVGPYRFVRNPMYIGGFTLLLGWALFRQSASLLILAGAFLSFFHLFVIAYEEPTLRGKFGEDYQGYLASVPRWIPARPR